MNLIIVFLSLIVTSQGFIDIDNLPEDPQLVYFEPAILMNEVGFLPDIFEESQQVVLYSQPIQTKNLIQMKQDDEILDEVDLGDFEMKSNDMENHVNENDEIQAEEINEQQNIDGVNNLEEQQDEDQKFIRRSSMSTPNQGEEREPGADEEKKLNWKVFAESLNGMLQNVQNLRQVESDNFERKKGLFDKIQKIHERDQNKIKIDLAKGNNNIQQNLEPYKNELAETLKYRESIFAQQKEQMQNNDLDRDTIMGNLKVELDEVTVAQQNIDKMIEVLEQAKAEASSFIQVQEAISPLSNQMQDIFQKHNNEPISELVNALVQVFTSGFRERKAIKEALDLLEKLRSLTLDFKLEIISQIQKQRQMYEDRKRTIQQDKEANGKIYSSKLEQYNSILEQLAESQDYIQNRQKDQKFTEDTLGFLKNIWATEQGIQQRLEQKLKEKAVEINDAIKQVGDGIQFEGEMLH